MNEVSFKFLAVKGTPHIVQALAHCASIVTTADKVPGCTAIVGVFLNGVPLKFRSVDATSVAVSPPIPFEGGRVELLCLAPETPSDAPQRSPATHPLPDLTYGLGARQWHKPRGF